MLKGRTKVMIGRDGTPKIQEETGDTVRVYTLDEWNQERDRRKGAGEEPGVQVELQDNPSNHELDEDPDDGANALIQEDDDSEEEDDTTLDGEEDDEQEEGLEGSSEAERSV